MAQETAIPRVPKLDGDPWHITAYPDLGDLAHSPAEHEVVDHHYWQAQDGKWRLWACVRGTTIGRLFYGWQGDSLEQKNWKPLGVMMRADRAAGESVSDWFVEEWIFAPFVIQENDAYYLFYGGHYIEMGEGQMCLAVSKDGHTFERYKNESGHSRVFVGPGETRDPYLIKIGDLWHLYYCAHDTGRRRPCKIYVRTSSDLVNWSDYRQVSYGGFTSGTGPASAECPVVVFVDGYYYLFRTSEYRSPARTHVYRSSDPYDFGLGDDSKWITTLRLAAPEIVKHGDQYYVSTVEDLKGGVQMFHLKWV